MTYIIKLTIFFVVIAVILWYSIYSWLITNLGLVITDINSEFIAYLPLPIKVFLTLLVLWILYGIIKLFTD